MFKYPRTLHLPFSKGKTVDDKVLSDCSCFEGKEIVATIKFDGENTTAYANGHIHARSLDSANHPSRNWVKGFLSTKIIELPQGWRICGENLYAKHSIHYKNLKSYFYMFSVWNSDNECLSWDDTIIWSELLEIVLVPVLYRGLWDEEIIKKLYNKQIDNNECEGFVVRLARSFSYENFVSSVGKYVRTDHVQTNDHWMYSKIIKNDLS